MVWVYLFFTNTDNLSGFDSVNTAGKFFVFGALALAACVVFAVLLVSLRDIFFGGKFGVEVFETYLTYTESNKWAYKDYQIMLNDIKELFVSYDSEGNTYKIKTSDGKSYTIGNLNDDNCNYLFGYLRQVCKNAQYNSLGNPNT